MNWATSRWALVIVVYQLVSLYPVQMQVLSDFVIPKDKLDDFLAGLWTPPGLGMTFTLPAGLSTPSTPSVSTARKMTTTPPTSIVHATVTPATTSGRRICLNNNHNHNHNHNPPSFAKTGSPAEHRHHGNLDDMGTTESSTDTGNAASVDVSNSSLTSATAQQGKIDYVGYVAVPFFLVTGLTGNTFTILIMRGKQFQKMTISTLLIALSLSDSLLVIMAPFNKRWFHHMLGVDVRSFSIYSCKVFYWFWRMAKMTSSWFVVIVAIERFFAVWFPLKVRSLSTKRNARIAVFLDYLLIGSFNFAWVCVADKLTPSGTCVPNQPALPEYKEISLAFIWAGSFVYSIIPTAILLVLTPMIIVRLFNQRKVRRGMANATGKSGGGGMNRDNTAKTTALLLGVAIAFLLMVNPIATAHIVSFVTGKNIFETNDPGMNIFREIAQLLEMGNYSINFFIYVIWNQQYRQRFLSMVSCLACTCRGKPSAFRKSKNESGTNNATGQTTVKGESDATRGNTDDPVVVSKVPTETPDDAEDKVNGTAIDVSTKQEKDASLKQDETGCDGMNGNRDPADGSSCVLESENQGTDVSPNARIVIIPQ